MSGDKRSGVRRGSAMLMVAAALLCACLAPAFADAPSIENDTYFIDGQETLKARRAVTPNTRRARNVILFVADGMDVTTTTAARIYDGQSRGEEGEENVLSFERFPYVALSKTYNTDAQTPDSAGTMSAMVTGVKTRIGVVSLTKEATRGDCESARTMTAPTILELAEAAGMATGVVSTARLTHATPAAGYAHTPNRNWERDSAMPAAARDAGCRDIARQLIEFPYGDGIDVAMGGGRSNFLPEAATDPEDADEKGLRKDGRDLMAEWRVKSPEHTTVVDRAGFDAIDPTRDPRVLGLFERSHMEYELDRANDIGGEPSLEEMTVTAIDILARAKKGYVLVVEAGRVDHAHHAGNAKRALADAQEYAEAVGAAVERVSLRDTLIIVTSDHGHTFHFAGYPAKGNDILGLVKTPVDPGDADSALSLTKAADGRPYTTLGYGNGPGSVITRLDAQGRRPLITEVMARANGYLQDAAVPLGSETHGGQDVAIYATGPRAYLLGGVVEQSYIFHVIDDALALRKRAKGGRSK
ncbi:MAG: alkaline phosphatase [Pseudomonadota bacterium]